jgi:hypothetical protein
VHDAFQFCSPLQCLIIGTKHQISQSHPIDSAILTNDLRPKFLLEQLADHGLVQQFMADSVGIDPDAP